MNFLCADTATGSNNVVVYVILIVMVLAMLILPYFTNKKRNKQYMDMLSSIKVGDLVKTAGGLIGRVTKITDKGEIKTIILETGSKNEKSYMEFDINSVYCVLKSTKVEESKQEDVSVEVEESKEPETKTEEVEVKTEDTAVSEEPKKETKPRKKTTSTKSKKTTK